MSLPGNPQDGKLGVLRVGSGVDRETVRLRYNASRDRWVQASPPMLVLRSINQVGAHLVADSPAPTTKQYVPLDNFPSFSDYWSPRHVGALMAQGLSFEYFHHAWLKGSDIGIKVHTGTYFYQYDEDESNTQDGVSPATPGHVYTIPPTGGWAETPTYLQGGSSGEREWAISDTWRALGAPIGSTGVQPVATKESIYPAQYAFCDAGGAGGTDGCLIFNYALWLRWIF